MDSDDTKVFAGHQVFSKNYMICKDDMEKLTGLIKIEFVF